MQLQRCSWEVCLTAAASYSLYGKKSHICFFCKLKGWWHSWEKHQFRNLCDFMNQTKKKKPLSLKRSVLVKRNKEVIFSFSRLCCFLWEKFFNSFPLPLGQNLHPCQCLLRSLFALFLKHCLLLLLPLQPTLKQDWTL